MRGLGTLQNTREKCLHVVHLTHHKVLFWNTVSWFREIYTIHLHLGVLRLQLCLYLSCRGNKLPQPSSLREEKVIMADSLRMGKSWWQELEAAGHIVHVTRIQMRMDAQPQLHFIQSRTPSLCLNIS